MLSAFLALIESKSDKLKFEQIYEKYKDLVFNIAYRYLNNYHLAQDATQESFARIAKNIKRFADIESDDTTKLIWTTAKHAAIYTYNRNKNHNEELVADCSGIIDYNQDNDSKENIVEAIKSLDSKYSEILILKYKYGYSVQEIAETLGLSFSTTKGRLYNGRKKLALKLNNADD